MAALWPFDKLRMSFALTYGSALGIQKAAQVRLSPLFPIRPGGSKSPPGLGDRMTTGRIS